MGLILMEMTEVEYRGCRGLSAVGPLITEVNKMAWHGHTINNDCQRYVNYIIPVPVLEKFGFKSNKLNMMFLVLLVGMVDVCRYSYDLQKSFRYVTESILRI